MAKVYVSDVIEAAPEEVWAVVRDFAGMAGWHPLIADMHIEDGKPADQVGCVRKFTLTDGGKLRESLLSLSDFDFHCRYDILESPLPLNDYVAEFRLIPITQGNRTFIEWSAEFTCSRTEQAGLVKLISDDVFLAGFAALKTRLE